MPTEPGFLRGSNTNYSGPGSVASRRGVGVIIGDQLRKILVLLVVGNPLIGSSEPDPKIVEKFREQWPEVQQWLRSEREGVQAQAASYIANRGYGRLAHKAVPFFLEFLRDSDQGGMRYPRHRGACVRALGAIGPQAAAAVDRLVAIAGNTAEAIPGEKGLEPFAIEALGRIGVGSEAVVDCLTTHLRSTIRHNGWAAGLALGRMEEGLPVLLETVDSNSPPARYYAFAGLCRQETWAAENFEKLATQFREIFSNPDVGRRHPPSAALIIARELAAFIVREPRARFGRFLEWFPADWDERAQDEVRGAYFTVVLFIFRRFHQKTEGRIPVDQDELQVLYGQIRQGLAAERWDGMLSSCYQTAAGLGRYSDPLLEDYETVLAHDERKRRIAAWRALENLARNGHADQIAWLKRVIKKRMPQISDPDERGVVEKVVQVLGQRRDRR